VIFQTGHGVSGTSSGSLLRRKRGEAHTHFMPLEVALAVTGQSKYISISFLDQVSSEGDKSQINLSEGDN
jgi:hypothetical protein